MPHCIICNTRIYDSNYYCTLHEPLYRRSRGQGNRNQSAYPRDTYMRTSTGAGTGGTAIALRHQHYNHHSAPALYDQFYGRTSVANTSRAHPLTQVFANLQDTHVIDYVTYDGQQITIKANLEREQCPTCYAWFASREKLDQHCWEYPVACEKHGICMRKDEVVWHANEKRHDRCFVRNCESVYRMGGGWRCSVVEKHVEVCHGHYR